MKTAKKKILLVEDFEDSRFSLSKLLQIEGFDVIEAKDGSQAVDLAESKNPDLILMDLSLPVVDGLTATRRIRQKSELASVPIIALSGHELVDIRREVRDSGCTDYVTKPVDFDQLTMMISKYLAG
ncbi:MAG TPA: response regulator [Blastocatellia bacterium]|nr:response regulator [Blastocatellia bacterium]